MALTLSKKVSTIFMCIVLVGALFTFLFVYPYKCSFAHDGEQGLAADDALRMVESFDFDNDCIPGDDDNCPARFNPLQLDEDKNGIGDKCQS